MEGASEHVVKKKGTKKTKIKGNYPYSFAPIDGGSTWA